MRLWLCSLGYIFFRKYQGSVDILATLRNVRNYLICYFSSYYTGFIDVIDLIDKNIKLSVVI